MHVYVHVCQHSFADHSWKSPQRGSWRGCHPFRPCAEHVEGVRISLCIHARNTLCLTTPYPQVLARVPSISPRSSTYILVYVYIYIYTYIYWYTVCQILCAFKCTKCYICWHPTQRSERGDYASRPCAEYVGTCCHISLYSQCIMCYILWHPTTTFSDTLRLHFRTSYP